MGIRINTNELAVKATNNLRKSSMALNKALNRLSSGSRINAAGDDAAGLAISEGLISQVRGNSQAIRNANDGLGFLATAEGALGELTSITQRIRELALQSATGSISATDRRNLDLEAQALISEFDRIAKNTDYNGSKLLDGSFTTTDLQVGIRKGQTISFNIGNARASQLGGQALRSGTQGAITSGINGLVINGIGIANSTADTESSAGASYSSIAIAAAINNKTGEHKVSADVLDTNVTLWNLEFSAGGFDGTLLDGDFRINGVSITGTSLTNINSLVDAINNKSSSTGVQASLAEGSVDDVLLTASDGRNIQIELSAAAAATDFYEVVNNAANFDSVSGVFGVYSASVSAQANLSVGTTFTVLTVAGYSQGVIRTGAIQLRSSEEIELTGSNISQSIGMSSSEIQIDNSISLQSVDISDQQGASDALSILDSVLRSITDIRAGLGAIQSRLEVSMNNLAIATENLSAAQSQIRDADIAVETAEMTRAQILQQAGVAVLAQANTTAQSALQLLRF